MFACYVQYRIPLGSSSLGFTYSDRVRQSMPSRVEGSLATSGKLNRKEITTEPAPSKSPDPVQEPIAMEPIAIEPRQAC